jgi:thiol-disulfide isomerase/thioredoxin
MEESRGKPRVLIFWTTWCQFSRPVVRALDELAREVERKHPAAVAFIAINVEENGAFERLRSRIEVDKLTSLNHAFSGNGVLDEAYLALNVATFPQIVVLDGQGTVVAEGNSVGTATNALEELGIDS